MPFTNILFDPDTKNRDFICDICNKYLSIAPILSNETVGTLCGRCFEKGDTKKFDVDFERQIVYEGIAKHLTFPCSFQANGCKEKLRWGEVSEHEVSCLFRKHECPFVLDVFILEENKCPWQGDNESLFLHLREEHAEYFNDELKTTITVSDNPKDTILISQFMEIPVAGILFMGEGSESIVVHLLMDTSFVQCKTYSYDLEVSNELGTHKIIFPEKTVNPLCEKTFTTKSLELGFTVDLAGLQAIMKTNCFNFYFKIKSKQSYPLKEEYNYSSNQDHIFDKTCVICKDTLFYPIYICKEGHNVCGDCFRTRRDCMCGVAITSDHNHTLEAISKMLLHTCKNIEEGCTQLISHADLRYHQQNCKFTEKECVMKCGWTGNNMAMLDHLKDIHFPIKLNEDYLYDGLAQYFCIIFNGKIFVLHIDYRPYQPLSLKVQCLDGGVGQYRFEFTIISGKLKMKIENFCQPLIHDKRDIEPSAIFYPYAFLQQFLSEKNNFYFKVNIFNVPAAVKSQSY